MRRWLVVLGAAVVVPESGIPVESTGAELARETKRWNDAQASTSRKDL